MLDTIRNYCKKENLIKDLDCVLVGVSGGADSVCLLLVLQKLQAEIHFALEAVHVEHGIRGEESKADADFVVNLCQQLEIPLHLYSVKALDYAREKKIGVEEAARELRYDCYMQAAKRVSLEKANQKVKIALAHHGNDNAETMLFQMIRGSGLDGLCGMQPKRELEAGVEVIRPMLSVGRSEIENYLKLEGQAYCIDSTNQNETYSRNKIRQSVLPILSEVNAQAVTHMNQSAELLRELNDYLREQVFIHAKDVLREQEEGLCILKEPFERMPAILQKELLHFALIKTAGMAKDIGRNHITLLQELFSMQVGRNISLPYGIVAKRSYEGIVLGTTSEILTMLEDFCITLEADFLEEQLLQGEYAVAVPGGRLQFRLLERNEETGKILKNTYTKRLDYDKIKGSFQIRTRMAGDYLIIDDAGHRKSLKEYFINEKVPEAKRNQILLLTADAKVLWVIGYRISADTKIDSQTKRILEIQIMEDEG